MPPSPFRLWKLPAPSMMAFTLATLAPLPLLTMGAWFGGLWLWAGFLYMAVLYALLDQIIAPVAASHSEGQEFPGADLLLVSIALAAFAIMGLSTWAIAKGEMLSSGQKVLLFLGAGFWLGQVAHPAAHELIHRSARPLFRLGQMFYAAVLYGQHASAHRLVHHRFVATALDPNSAREGESFYHFAPRAWWGSFKAGFAAETALRRREKGGKRGLHPYLLYGCGGAAALGLGFSIAGWAGLLWWIALSLHVQMQILVSDYVQHYGLRRKIKANGRPEPVTAAHSWNSPHWFSSAMMLNATRHSDHHIHPSRPFPALRFEGKDRAPELPWPLPLACALAFMPRLWQRRMRHRLRQWQVSAGDEAPGREPKPAHNGQA